MVMEQMEELGAKEENLGREGLQDQDNMYINMQITTLQKKSIYLVHPVVLMVITVEMESMGVMDKRESMVKRENMANTVLFCG